MGFEMAFRARNVSGTFEKRAPEYDWGRLYFFTSQMGPDFQSRFTYEERNGIGQYFYLSIVIYPMT